MVRIHRIASGTRTNEVHRADVAEPLRVEDTALQHAGAQLQHAEAQLQHARRAARAILASVESCEPPHPDRDLHASISAPFRSSAPAPWGGEGEIEWGGVLKLNSLGVVTVPPCTLRVLKELGGGRGHEGGGDDAGAYLFVSVPKELLSPGVIDLSMSPHGVNRFVYVP